MIERRQFDWSVLQPRPSEEPTPAPAPELAGAVPQPEGSVLKPATGKPLPASMRLRVNDLKQYAYCPRIVFYQYTMPVQRKATFKMEHGKAVEPRLEQLEQRRTLRKYGLAEGTRQFQVSLTSAALGLSGRLDLLITTARGVFPVDFKDTLDRVHHNHRVQLCAYAFLIEEHTGRPVTTGFIYRVPRNDVVVVDVTPELRVETQAIIEAIREMTRAERMPPPTPVRARCEDCEYRNYCGDIF